MEKYLQIEWGPNLVFRDILAHLSCSLERLVESLLKVGEHKFKHLAHMTEQLYGPMHMQEKIRLLIRKGVFPYDYVKNMEGLNETLLPPREAFYNRLSGSECSPPSMRTRRMFGIHSVFGP